MLKKVIKFTDYNGIEQEEELYFNLSKAEMLEMEVLHPGGLTAYLNQIVDAKDGKLIMEKFKWLLLKSFGKKSVDGKIFMKTEEISKEFECSPAYNELFMLVCFDANFAADFIKGVLPKKAQEKK